MLTTDLRSHPFITQLKDLINKPFGSNQSTANVLEIPSSNLYIYLNATQVLPPWHLVKLITLNNLPPSQEVTIWEQYDHFCELKNTAKHRRINQSMNFPKIIQTTDSLETLLKAAYILSGDFKRTTDIKAVQVQAGVGFMTRAQFEKCTAGVNLPENLQSLFAKRAVELYKFSIKHAVDSLIARSDYKSVLKLLRLDRGLSRAEVIKEIGGSSGLFYKYEDSTATNHIPFNKLKILLSLYKPDNKTTKGILTAYATSIEKCKLKLPVHVKAQRVITKVLALQAESANSLNTTFKKAG